MKKLILAFLLSLFGVDNAQAAYALVQHTSCAGAAGTACTTTAASFTGVDLIVLSISYWTGGAGTSAPSDSSGNSYSTMLSKLSQGTTHMQHTVYYVQAPAVTGSMTFTASATGGSTYPAMTVAGFSGSGASPLDQTNFNDGSGLFQSSLGSGSITPTAANELVISSWGVTVPSAGPTSGEAASAMTVTDVVHGTSTANWGNALAYVVQTTALPSSTTWSWTTSGYPIVLIGSFKTGGAAPTCASSLLLKGEGAC